MEQTFSKIERNHLHRHSGSADTFRRSVLGLTSQEGASFKTDEVLVEAARVLQSQNRCYVAKNKTSGRKTRFDAGSKKPISALPENTEAAFLRKRKADLKGLTRGGQASSRGLTGGGQASSLGLTRGGQGEEGRDPVRGYKFDAAMKKEEKKCLQEVKKRRVEAFEDNFLLDSEKPSRKDIQKQKAEEAKNDRERIKKQAYVDNMCKLAQEKKPMHFFYVLLQGRTAWIDDEASPEERQAAVQAGLTALTSSLDEANVAFVTNSSPEKRAFWHMMLRGGAVVARDFLTVKRHVFVLQYRSGIEIHLKLFMSDNFKAKHVQITACLQHHIHAEPTSKWEEIGQNQAKVVLCLENEKRSFSKPGVRVHTAESFFERLATMTLLTDKSGRLG